MILDYSAHAAWDTCSGYWFEKYINKRSPRWKSGQRDDALALGSLVHEGLRLWQERQIVEIPTEVIDEVTPTRECLSLAQELVYGYTRAYPQELWPLIRCEEPVLVPDIGPDLTLLAKIDSYFYVPEVTTIESGIPGLMLTLNPGWWIHEYKTKSPFIPMALYMQSWEMNLQASYQVLALKHKLREITSGRQYSPSCPINCSGGCPNCTPDELENQTVQGTLINVLEKPRRHIPKRKCRSCQETYEFYTWISTGRGTYACPVCGSEQTLTPLKQDVPTIPPAYYRLVVTRSPTELERDREIILSVGQRMIAMERGGLTSEPWRKSSCVNFQWKRACEYFGNHKNNVSTLDDPNFHTPPDYRGLAQIET